MNLFWQPKWLFTLCVFLSWIVRQLVFDLFERDFFTLCKSAFEILTIQYVYESLYIDMLCLFVYVCANVWFGYNKMTRKRNREKFIIAIYTNTF